MRYNYLYYYVSFFYFCKYKTNERWDLATLKNAVMQTILQIYILVPNDSNDQVPK